ncbi:MAG: hypothetical protein Q4E63_02810 [Prevotellaceae bacterium]|nr:hypothetical protein [Prevotellaceae bacterium]
MEQDINKIETTGAGVEKVHTKLKFIKSEKNGAFISFVSQNPVNGVVCGVRQDSPYPKKIVIIDREMSNNILPNVLYDCTLIPMTKTINKKTGEEHIPGYIAIEANAVQFKATVTTKYVRGSMYQVEVAFGNKIIRFDPFHGQKESVKSLPACLAVLEKRCDVKDLMYIVESFNTAAIELVEQMKQDMREIHNKRGKNEKAGRRNRH